MIVVSISGIVGSGKSTAARAVADWFAQDGTEAIRARFQQLPCFRIARAGGSPGAAEVESADAERPQPVRRAGYRRSPFTLRVLLVHLWRVAAYRAYARYAWRDRVVILDRYFYDSLIHRVAHNRRQRCYAALMRRVIPAPDLAMTLHASPGVIRARRPGYSEDYVERAVSAYAELPLQFPALVVICTDPGADVAGAIHAALRNLTRASASRPR